MKIIAIITTKNREELFERALLSVINQTRKADRVIVVSDSLLETRQMECKLTTKYGVELIEDVYTHNYAGSLNSAIHYFLKSDILGGNDYDDTYIAFLDDDDVWHNNYLEECEKVLSGEDFVVSGLIYCNEEGKKQLSIPDNLTIDSFLKGNPHIQGSNTFIKLTTLLRAGLFDENMSSTTDRDIFTRVMLLKPKYAICYKYLVEVDAYNSRERITNGKLKKVEGLRKFYYKYNGYMSDSVKQAFFERAQNLFEIGKSEIENIDKINRAINREFSTIPYTGNLTIGFIATEYKLGLRLLEQLVAINRKNTRIVIFINFIEDRSPYIDLLNNSVFSYEIIDRKRVLHRIEKGGFDQFVTEDKLHDEIIKDIAVTRTILQKYLHENTCDGDAIWVLDEDMELKELVLEGEKIEEKPIDIDKIISTYKSDYDAVVGNYALDAPLPTLSTLRVSLLDYVYNKRAKIGENTTLADFTDYYYDMSDFGNVHLETPLRLKKSCTIEDVFSGKAQSRPLFIYSSDINEVKSRGGNTLIFNRKLLEIPNWSIQINDKIGRRSDYFWALRAKRQGYKLANVPFATLHNRSYNSFNIAKEEEKLLLDLIGSSFTKAVDVVGIDAKKEEFFKEYKDRFINRLVKYVASFYRINGLLSIVEDEKYIKDFSFVRLKTFLHEAENYIQKNEVMSAFCSFQWKLHMQTEMLDKDVICEEIAKYFLIPINTLRLLGNGGEGVVFTDKKYVYKYFFNTIKNLDFLKTIAKQLYLNEQLYSLEFFEMNGKTVIRYQYEKSEPYKGGHEREFAEFLRFAKDNGFVFDNYKKDNFVVVNGKLKLVDYGKSFLPYSEELHEKSITRVFEMLRYPFLNEDEFKQIIQRSYQNDTKYIDDGRDLFKAVVKQRYKENLHDDIILELADGYSPQNILDYGAGKCKLANKLAKKYNVDVFDIDIDTIKKRADKLVNILEKAENISKSSYDLILNNLVLCCVENKTVEQIIQNIMHALKKDGHAIISICNPFFNDVQNTELRTSGLSGNYNQSEIFIKQATVGAPIRKEYHRPIDYYINLFARNGLCLEKIVEGRGVNMDTLLPIAEHIVFACKKIAEPIIYTGCSLLIKTNPMEYRSIYRNIRHIVTTLEKGGRFEKRVAVADLTAIENRARRYDTDDVSLLKSELERAKLNGLLDEVIYVEDNTEKMKATYRKYFGLESTNGHASNGQGLYATLMGFEAITTDYVFQTDSDILYYNNDSISFLQGLEELKRGAITATIGVASEQNEKSMYGTRTEVRTCFLNLMKLNTLLPLPNTIESGTFKLTWHRTLDKILQNTDSVRLKNKNVWFIHPENDKKKVANFVSYVERFISAGKAISEQYGEVNLQADKKKWTEKTDADVVVYIRGYNTPCEKLKRMFDSLKRQTYQNYKIVYVDDASTNESADYAKFILENDSNFTEKSIALFNDTNVGELDNFVFVMQNVITNKNAIVINLDNDDYLVNKHAIEIIVNEFNNGAEVTCGNCIRYDKPLKRYKIKSFDNVWERDGDNIWLHPKCFRRYLFDFIDIEKDLKIDGRFIDVNTDFAIMLPIIRNAKKKVFIEDVLYYFEPSFENIRREGKYKDEYKLEIKRMLLQKEKEYYEQRTKV